MDSSGGTYPRLPGLAAQSSTASGEGITEDASLPPIANLSLSKANMSGATAAGAAGHTSTRRATMNNFYDGNGGSGPSSYKAKAGAAGGGAASGVTAGAAPGGAAAASATGMGPGPGGVAVPSGVPPPANSGAVGRRQSVGVVAGKYGSVNKQTSSGHGQAGVVPPGAAIGAAMGSAMGVVAAARTEPQGGTIKFKANVGKSNSKYISPYSLRQLAGQNAAGQV